VAWHCDIAKAMCIVDNAWRACVLSLQETSIVPNYAYFPFFIQIGWVQILLPPLIFSYVYATSSLASLNFCFPSINWDYDPLWGGDI
jgi:hypothetical protein